MLGAYGCLTCGPYNTCECKLSDKISENFREATWAELCESKIKDPETSFSEFIGIWMKDNTGEPVWDFLGLSFEEFVFICEFREFPARVKQC